MKSGVATVSLITKVDRIVVGLVDVVASVVVIVVVVVTVVSASVDISSL